MSSEANNNSNNNNPRKYNSKGVRGVLVNLELGVAEQFYTLSKQLNSSASRKAKELIEQFVKDHGSPNVGPAPTSAAAEG
jgi:hypothetical protein